jgi:hypothetical protein
MAGDAIRAQWVLAGARPAGTAILFELEGRLCRTREGLFAHWAERLRFPDYFGGNWDAFEECLRDFFDRYSSDGSPCIVRIDHAAELVADGAEADLITLVEIVRSAAEQALARGGSVVEVELIDEPHRLADLRDRVG